MLSRKRTSPIESKSDKFLLKLYEILGKEEYSKIIHWSQNGSYIVITNIHELSKKILPIYFNHQNYSSFVRQLNMYNFHKIRTDPDKQEQYFINETLNKNKSMNDILNFKRKEKKQKCLFFQDEDAKIKYTILSDKKNEDTINLDEDLDENDENITDKYNKLIKEGKLNQNIKNRMMLLLLNKSKQNLEQKNELKNKLKELNEQSSVTNSQIANLNGDVENQNIFLKKIKNIYFFLVNLYARRNSFNCEKNVENKINSGNNDISKKNSAKTNLSDFVHRYVNFRGRKDIIGSLNKINKNRLNNNSLNKKNNSYKNKFLSNTVQRGENFSINQETFNFDDYLNNFELRSIKSRKSNKFNDSFSFSADDKNFNSSLPLLDNNNNWNNINFDDLNYKTNQNIFSDDILF